VDTLTRDEVLRLARLARLELTEGEIERFTRQLRDILAFAQQVNTVDTSGIVEASPDPAGGPDVLRDDVVRPSLKPAEVLALAPEADRDSGLFKVPRVFNR